MRAAVVSTLEGVMLFGVFHGDLHGGNLFVLPDGRVALLDFGITGRLDEHHRAGVPPPRDGGDDERRARPGRGAAASSARYGPTPTSTR